MEIDVTKPFDTQQISTRKGIYNIEPIFYWQPELNYCLVGEFWWGIKFGGLVVGVETTELKYLAPPGAPLRELYI